MEVQKLLKGLGYDYVDISMQTHIETWKQYYKGNVDKFHNYNEYNGKKLVKKERKTLGMPKMAAEDWADSLFNDNVDVVVEESFQDMFDGILEVNNFREQFAENIERCFAFGTSGLVEYKDSNGYPIITYYTADQIFPLEYSGKEIISCAFISETSNKNIYVNIHERLKNGSYLIRNIFLKKNRKDNFDVIKNKDVKDKYTSSEKLFQVYSPNIANNKETNTAMGISCFANAVHETKSIDVNYDSFDNEIRNGMKRTYVTVGGLGFQLNDDLETVPIFDEAQTTFYQLPGNEEESAVVQETQGELRIDALVKALQTNLNLYGRKVGLGNDYYSFENGTVYTNTSSVISSNSKFYKTLKKHEKVILRVIKELTRALYYLNTGNTYTGDTSVDFDDSIFEDVGETKKQALLELNNDIIDRVQYVIDVYKMTEEQAVEFIDKIDERKGSLEEEPPLEE